MEQAKEDLARCGIEGAKEFMRELPARPSLNARRSREEEKRLEKEHKRLLEEVGCGQAK